MSFESALRDVTGRSAELRLQAAPPGGWLLTVPPGTASWWNYYPFGEMVFSVDVNDQALDSWNRAVGDLGRVMPEIARGEHGLMQVPRLRDAESRIRGYTRLLGAGATHARSIAGPVIESADIDGESAIAIGRRTTAVATRLDAQHSTLTTGAPPVADALHDAAEALASFGRKTAEAFWAARHTLDTAVPEGIAAIMADIVAFLVPHDLATEDGVLISYPPDHQGEDTQHVRNLFATYTPGIEGVTGSPATPALWESASAAMTRKLTAALDDLDDAAARALGELRDTYRSATRAMGGPITPETTTPRAEEAVQPAEQAAARLATPFGALNHPLGSAVTEPLRDGFSALTPMTPAVAGTPMRPMTPAVPATPAQPAGGPPAP